MMEENLILKELRRIMSALTDLQGAVANLNTQTTAELQAIAAKLASFGDSVSGPDVENAVAQINSVAAELQAETTALVGTSTGTGTGTATGTGTSS
jgi:hypothetical protein